MHVSIVICTYNRCGLLRRTLESVRALIVPPGLAWQVVVVNNNSTDDTEAVLESYASLVPLERTFQPVLGLSRARNRGVSESSGDLLLFTDDDVQVDPHWMANHLDAARRWRDAAYFAGPIRADFADDVPDWVRRHAHGLHGMLCSLDLGAEPRLLERDEYPWGPNMAVRRSAFACASFDPAAGRIGRRQMRGSERTLFDALRPAGARGAWVPGAKVDHHVPRSRASFAYLLRYYAALGRGAAKRESTPLPTTRRQIQMLAEATRGLVEHPREWPPRVADVVWRIARLVETRHLAMRKHSGAPATRRSENAA